MAAAISMSSKNTTIGFVPNEPKPLVVDHRNDKLWRDQSNDASKEHSFSGSNKSDDSDLTRELAVYRQTSTLESTTEYQRPQTYRERVFGRYQGKVEAVSDEVVNTVLYDLENGEMYFVEMKLSEFTEMPQVHDNIQCLVVEAGDAMKLRILNRGPDAPDPELDEFIKQQIAALPDD